MPTIRDARGQLTSYETLPPPGSPSGPVIRDRVSEARMADFAAERAREAERKRTTRVIRSIATGEYVAVSTPEPGPEEKPMPDVEKSPLSAAAVSRGGSGARPLPRDEAARMALVLDAVRSTPSLTAAGAKLGVTNQRVGQLVQSFRRAGVLPDDVDRLVKARGRSRPSTSKVDAIEPSLDTHSSSIKAVIEPRSVKSHGVERAPHKHSDQIKGQEAGAPVTDAVDRGTTGTAPATEVATPPGPTPVIEEAYSAPVLTTPADVVSLHLTLDVSAAEMATWQPERIRLFFQGVANVTTARWGLEA